MESCRKSVLWHLSVSILVSLRSGALWLECFWIHFVSMRNELTLLWYIVHSIDAPSSPGLLQGLSMWAGSLWKDWPNLSFSLFRFRQHDHEY